jgi:hypothetical protein
MILTDVSVTINSVDLSDHIRSVSLTREVEAVEDSTMSTPSRSYEWGPDSWSGTLNFKQNYTATEVDDTFNTIFAGRAAVTLVVLPTSSAAGANNPSFTGSVIPTTIPLVDGDWGSLAENGIPFQGTGTLTRAVV